MSTSPDDSAAGEPGFGHNIEHKVCMLWPPHGHRPGTRPGRSSDLAVASAAAAVAIGRGLARQNSTGLGRLAEQNITLSIQLG